MPTERSLQPFSVRVVRLRGHDTAERSDSENAPLIWISRRLAGQFTLVDVGLVSAVVDGQSRL